MISIQSFLSSFLSLLSCLSTGDSSYTLFLYFPLSGSTYSARVSMTVAVSVSRPIPDTSFRRRIGRENMPGQVREGGRIYRRPRISHTLFPYSAPDFLVVNSPRLPACSNSTLSAYIFLSILQLACREPNLAMASSLDARDWTCFIL